MPTGGLQLWKVRDACDRNLERMLRTVSAPASDEVELLQLHGHRVVGVEPLAERA